MSTRQKKSGDSKKRGLSRRDFLKSAAVGSGAMMAIPCIVPSRVLGADAPSNVITIGCIGTGRMGRGDIMDILGFKEVQIVAVCDVDSKRAEDAKVLVEKGYSDMIAFGKYKSCSTYGDFREVIGREDIDAVMIVTPDHWHALPAIAAAKAGKDIFLQKPLSLTIPEGRVLADTVKRYGNVFLVGSQQRSDSRFRFGCELVRNGRIGELHTVKVGFDTDPACEPQPVMPVPKNLNYDMWLGPAPWAEYTENRVHPDNDYGRPGWLRISDYSAGMITGWGSHHIDIAHWGMGTDRSGPVQIEGTAEYPQDGLWDVHGDFYIEYKYANGVKLICADNKVNKQGVVFEGTEGWVYVNRGLIETYPKSLLSSKIRSEEIHLYKSTNHKTNFVECIKSRAETIAPAEVAHRSCSACVLGDIAMRLGRKLRWDPEKEQFIGDSEANKMVSRPMRSPWSL